MPKSTNSPCRVLVAEESQETRSLIRELLKQRVEYEATFVEDEVSALKLLPDFEPNLVVFTLEESIRSNHLLCRHLRKNTFDYGYIGILFLLDKNSVEHIEQGLHQGGDDFCLRTNISFEFMPRILSVARLQEMTNALYQNNETLRIHNHRLRRLNITDDLTKLYNMKYFKRRMQEEFVRARRYKKDLSVIMFDIDYFKNVNDNADHLLGSFVLAQLGRLVKQSVRNIDIAARFGGDEFVILLPETKLSGASILAERILDEMKTTVFDNGRDTAEITASFGVTTLSLHPEFKDPSELIRRADQLLYQAKAEGRARVVVEVPKDHG